MGLEWGGPRQPAIYGVSTKAALLRLFLSTVLANVTKRQAARRRYRRYVKARDAIVKRAGHQPIGKTWGILRYPQGKGPKRNG